MIIGFKLKCNHCQNETLKNNDKDDVFGENISIEADINSMFLAHLSFYWICPHCKKENKTIWSLK